MEIELFVVSLHLSISTMIIFVHARFTLMLLFKL